ncbi:MAG: nitroreductase family protein [Armatimonadota bacterium]
MDAIDCIKSRRSIRQYDKTPVEKKIIEDIVDCGRLAATALNLQPLIFIVVTEESTRKKLADICEYGKFIADAPCCIVIFSEKTKYFLEDGSAATQNILLGAKAYGLGSCWVAGDKKPYADDIRKLLDVPDNYTLISSISIGYSNSDPKPSKKPLSEVLMWEKFDG